MTPIINKKHKNTIKLVLELLANLAIDIKQNIHKQKITIILSNKNIVKDVTIIILLVMK